MSTSPTQPDNNDNTRTAIEIAWSCIAVIYACTWTAIHPNVPTEQISSSSWKLLIRRILLTFWALLVPELMVQWATRQWLDSRRISRAYKEVESAGEGAHSEKIKKIPWTSTHSFFLVMGGFTIQAANEQTRPLCFDDMKPYITERLSRPHPHSLDLPLSIPFPRLPEDEIKDKSKGDALAKAVVVGQTLWFLIQLLSRAIRHLAITELEIMTLAYAVISGILYALWWNKPYDVQKSIQLDNGHFYPQFDRQPPLRITVPDIVSGNLIFQLHGQVVDDRQRHTVLDKTFDETFFRSHADLAISLLASVISSTIFGSIHCIAWNFHFPTNDERIIWITCSIIVTVVPLVWIIVMCIVGLLVMIERRIQRQVVKSMIEYGVGFPLLVPLPILLYSYFVCRLILIVQAFLLLRGLSPSAMQAVEWSSFIPHI